MFCVSLYEVKWMWSDCDCDCFGFVVEEERIAIAKYYFSRTVDDSEPTSKREWFRIPISQCKTTMMAMAVAANKHVHNPMTTKHRTKGVGEKAKRKLKKYKWREELTLIWVSKTLSYLEIELCFEMNIVSCRVTNPTRTHSKHHQTVFGDPYWYLSNPRSSHLFFIGGVWPVWYQSKSIYGASWISSIRITFKYGRNYITRVSN